MEGSATVDRPIVGGSFAFGYYRRQGVNGSLVRAAKELRRKQGYSEVDPLELAVESVVTLLVYPELRLRDVPWEIHGIVVGNTAEAVTVRETTSSVRMVEGGDFTIPFRYFFDGRVYVKD